MPHIAIMAPPIMSHVNPTLGLTRELVARGNRVTYVSTPTFADPISATGARFAAYRSTLPVATGRPPQAENGLDVLELSVNEDMSVLPQLRAIFGEDPPDLVLHEKGADAIKVLARDLGVPGLDFLTTGAPWNGQHEYALRQMATALNELREVELYKRYAEWLAENGVVDTDPAEFLLAEPERALVLIPRLMQLEPEAVDENRYIFVGWCADRHDPLTSWERPDGVTTLVLISAGSVLGQAHGFYRECLTAFADLPGWHVVLQVDKHMDLAILGDIPANVEVHRWVPQVAILAACDIFITHGGMNSSIEGLLSATPMIVVPFANDQFSNAERLVELGSARRLNAATVTATQLRAAAHELTSDRRIADRASRLSRDLLAERGPSRAADMVEAALR